MIEPLEGERVGWHVPGPPTAEDRFTGPTDECPHPEWWYGTDADSTEVEVSDMVWGLVRCLQPRVCIETGSGWGQTTLAIAKALRQNGHGRLITLETEPRRVDYVRVLVDGYPVKVLGQESLTWQPAADIYPGTIDFAWFDSLYRLRVPEFLAFRPWLAPGAVVCFHDTAPRHGHWEMPSGRDLRSEIEAEIGDQLIAMHLPTPRGVTVAQLKR